MNGNSSDEDIAGTSLSGKYAMKRYIAWWPLLLGPLAMVGVYIAGLAGRLEYVSKPIHERMAPWLLLIPLVGFALRAAVARKEFYLFMAVFSAVLFCREWHFTGTGPGVYVGLGLLAFWAVRRKDHLWVWVAGSPLRIWLGSVLATYALSQLIARRFFRHLGLPYEDEFHIALEETVETAGHLMMIVVLLLAWRLIPRSAKTVGQCAIAAGKEVEGIAD